MPSRSLRMPGRRPARPGTPRPSSGTRCGAGAGSSRRQSGNSSGTTGVRTVRSPARGDQLAVGGAHGDGPAASARSSSTTADRQRTAGPDAPAARRGRHREPVPVAGDHVHGLAGRRRAARRAGPGTRDPCRPRSGRRRGRRRETVTCMAGSDRSRRARTAESSRRAAVRPSSSRARCASSTGPGSAPASSARTESSGIPTRRSRATSRAAADLVRCVPPVAGARIHRGRHQHAGAVVEPQRADRQPGQPRDRADRQQGVLHAGGPWSLDPLEGQPADRARTSATLARHTSSQSVGASPSSRSVAFESSTNGRTNW